MYTVHQFVEYLTTSNSYNITLAHELNIIDFDRKLEFYKLMIEHLQNNRSLRILPHLIFFSARCMARVQLSYKS